MRRTDDRDYAIFRVLATNISQKREDSRMRDLEGAIMAPFTQSKEQNMKALVINGPNINMLGIREPGIYGEDSYQDLVARCKQAGTELGFDEVECFQSNHEGAIIDKIQEAYGVFDGIVINPAAYTHTSVGILDALKAVSIPAVEVHISAVEEREEFRQVSYARLACFATITGEGLAGYRHALELIAEHLASKR